MPTKVPTCMTVDELAQRLGIDRRTIRNAMLAGTFPLGFVIRGNGKVNNQYVIPREPAEHFLRTGRLPE